VRYGMKIVTKDMLRFPWKRQVLAPTYILYPYLEFTHNIHLVARIAPKSLLIYLTLACLLHPLIASFARGSEFLQSSSSYLWD